ncbi:MAG: hypothetical protein M3273_06525 [Actinomycetota bacterium]|nr:hypothetical protein [Actinomycetota bacterium]
MRTARSIAMALSLPLILAATSMQATAAAPKPQIEDPIGDANFVNDQGTGDGTFGDQTQADAGNASDLMAVTFSNDTKALYVTIQTELAPPATQGIGLRARVNGEPGSQCILFEIYYPGATTVNMTEAQGLVRDTCEGGAPAPVEVLGTTLVVPRSLNEAFGKGQTLTTPQAQSFVYTGTNYPAGLSGPYIDTTKVGTDYKLKK